MGIEQLDLTSPDIKPDALARDYARQVGRRYACLLGLVVALAVLAVLAVALGAYDLSPRDVIRVLLGLDTGPKRVVVYNIRLPRIAAAMAVGWGLGLSGLATQTLLKNNLASPFTLGISQGAAFGAAFSIVVLGAGVLKDGALRVSGASELLLNSIYAAAVFAFLGAMVAAGVILLLARLRNMTPQSVILAGVALSSLFMSGTILVQYFATETELAAVVFWTFGDVARSGWPEITLVGLCAVGATAYFVNKRWDLNALLSGREAAMGLGVNVDRLRLVGMFLAALIAALATAFHGVIAFLGLLAPHISRRLVGADHRLLIPFSGVVGALLLLAADTLGRAVIGSGTLPVGVLTSFMGAPLFLYLLLKGGTK